MAVTRINLSDPVSTLVTKTNTISGDLGNIAKLYSGDSNTVEAINRLSLQPKVDSAQVQRLARIALSGTEVITYNNTTGIIGVDSSGVIAVARGGLSGSEAITYNSTTGVIGMDSAHFDDLIDSAIKNTITVSMTEGGGNYLAFSKTTGILYSIDRFRGSTTISHDSANRWFQLIDSSVTTAKLAGNAVTTAKLNGLAVTTAKLAGNAVTTAKLATNIPVTTFTNIGTLNILDSDGTTLHTLYKAT